MFHHGVTFLFLSLWVGLASIASSSCDSDIGGCQDETTLLQVGASAHAFGQEGRTSAQALLLELGGNLGTAKGQGDLLQFGEQLVRMTNATKNLNESEESVLEQVINLINDTLIPNIDADHAANNQLLVDDAAAIIQCNSVLGTSNSSGGDVGIHRGSTTTARAGHLSCRAGELVDYNAKVSATTALFAHIALITPVHQAETVFNAEWKSNNNVDAIAAYFGSQGAQLYVNWFNGAKTAFEAEQLTSQTANTTLSEKTVVCNTAQKSFETAYALFKEAFDSACTLHNTCYTDGKTHYDTLLARLKAVEANHHAAYEAAIIIMSKIQCLLAQGTHSDCSDPTIEQNRYVLTKPSVPIETNCDKAEVEHAVCDVDGLGAFESNEYASLHDNTPALPC